jgi:hypothetical protein
MLAAWYAGDLPMCICTDLRLTVGYTGYVERATKHRHQFVLVIPSKIFQGMLCSSQKEPPTFQMTSGLSCYAGSPRLLE